MNLPKKITPDSIKEAVVEVRFESGFPPELLPGIMFEAFDISYNYTNRPVRAIPSVPLQGNQQEVRIQVGNQSFLFNDKIIIQIAPKALIFTCFSNYIGWSDYELEIRTALEIAFGTGRIGVWTRLGVRYISEYPQMDLRSCTNFNFQFGLPDVLSDTVGFKSEFFYKGYKVILNLNNLVPLYTRNGENIQSIPTSLIDIDVIQESLEISKVNDLMSAINFLHHAEKEIFFGLLRHEFLDSLKPEY